MSGIHGLFSFYGAGDMHADPAERAAFAYSIASTAAGVLIESVEGTKQPVARVKAHCDALVARDVDPWLFVFTTSNKVPEAIEHAVACARATGVWKIVPDLEPFHAFDWTEGQIRQFVDGLRAAGFVEIAITLFTRQRWDHIDWEIAAPRCAILLQAYERANDPQELALAVHRWPGRLVIVLFGTYLEGGVERVKHDTANCTPWAKKVGAAGLWKLGSTSKEEGAAIRDWIVGALGPPASAP